MNMAKTFGSSTPILFNPETSIPFELSQDAEVRLTIYDVTGKTVRKMQLGYLTAGSYSQTVIYSGINTGGLRAGWPKSQAFR